MRGRRAWPVHCVPGCLIAPYVSGRLVDQARPSGLLSALEGVLAAYDSFRLLAFYSICQGLGMSVSWTMATPLEPGALGRLFSNEVAVLCPILYC